MRKIAFLLILSFTVLYPNILENISQTQYKYEQERIKKIEEQKNSSNIIFETKQKQLFNNLIKEEPCFVINDIKLIGKDSYKFQKYLKTSLNKIGFKQGMCLGQQSISVIHDSFGNEILSAGFVTTFVNMPSQNLKSGLLKFEILAGKINNLILNDKNTTKNRATLFTAFGGFKRDEILNLRHIEQALEIIQNASTGSVNLELIPSAKENYSDVKITKEEKLPLSVSLSVDNMGSSETGKYQSGINLNTFNLLGFNEIFYTSYSRNIFKTDKKIVGDDTKKGGSNNIYYGLTIPFGRFSIDFNEYKYEYIQAIAGAWSVYEYGGRSKRRNLTLNYMYYRNQISKNSIYFKIWEKENKNYIEKYELDNQRRKTAGYEIGLNSKFFINNGHISTGLAYTKGTGARNSIVAPEEEYGDGTSRFETIVFDFNFRKTANISPLTYDFKFHGMWNNTPLTMQEKLSIGGYNTVRGFDSKMSLVGNRGYYIKNTIEYDLFNTNTIYTAFDFGKVSGSNSKYLTDDLIVGTGVGLKGSLKQYGALSYDIFLGLPVRKPDFFETDNATLNFTLNYSF